MADKIKIVPADFQKATSELRRIEDLLNDHKTELAHKYSEMVSEWQGFAGDAFDACSQKLLDDFEKNIADLNQLSMDIEQTRQFMEEVDQKLAGEIGIS